MTDSIEIKPIDYVCSDQSRNIGESMLGSAPVAWVWFLLEYDKAWGYDAIDESLIPDEVKKHLLMAMKELDPAMTLIIKQSAATPSNRKNFYVAVANENPKLYKVPLGNYEALLDLDLVAMAKGDAYYERFRTDESIWLTCTNGMRDQCCSRVGGAVYNAFKETVGDAAWQCSHVGGHRFSGNVVHFPSGVFYGRIEPEDVSHLISSENDNRLMHGNLRGRACYPKPAQAAEGLLRERKPSLRSGDLRLRGMDAIDDHNWRVKFTEGGGRRTHEMQIRKFESSDKIYLSCLGEKQGPPTTYEIAEYQES
ncbi:MAG: hypothetical protein DWQ07_00050 [Chloroflexi bacterium]|nr:MAG: hypothetical protein DWQ07_00050 [Chloroflexota bacterium]MBL1196047.1 hypothetical protein [Chloroflexota bacterium]NOH13341.1 hypothetical protein [Chloroflexota bacterium]